LFIIEPKVFFSKGFFDSVKDIKPVNIYANSFHYFFKKTNSLQLLGGIPSQTSGTVARVDIPDPQKRKLSNSWVVIV
jgi:hypothetical protein